MRASNTSYAGAQLKAHQQNVRPTPHWPRLSLPLFLHGLKLAPFHRLIVFRFPWMLIIYLVFFLLSVKYFVISPKTLKVSYLTWVQFLYYLIVFWPFKDIYITFHFISPLNVLHISLSIRSKLWLDSFHCPQALNHTLWMELTILHISCLYII